ncbi:phosphate ABC transporter substrate-binding protein PstS [Paludibacterium paludis]|uniref:Phosphate-binding protein PstS n=1 Tax=Paludibacterium paludis TaxID=1225769 RepID=A0A918P2G9_9NEIS|nr:phosphate ABC transporter substrate-binding protein PstS [Paludibacterium paludis]GGY14470.1 phosphate-binding protein PstS [Paludibacterium paludis]
MKLATRLVTSVVLGSAFISSAYADITGAGATFPYPLYAKWAEAFKASSGISMNYQSIGSGGGIKQIEAKTVDFGASDKPLKPEELQTKGLVQFPTVVGGVVPVINVKGVKHGQLKLTGSLLADIYLGKVKTWNDPAIAKLNPGVALPSDNIVVVHRSDGSGTSFIFTHYLSQVSSEWSGKVGADSSVNWPVGVGGKGNEGVANYVTRINGSIGYVESAYAKQNKLNYSHLQNRDGKFVGPDEDTFKAAAAHADWKKAPGFYLILTNQPGAQTWPITGATFILMQKKQDKPAQGAEVLKFFDWAYKTGDKQALDLDYIPMPDSVKSVIRDSWKHIGDASGKPIVK